MSIRIYKALLFTLVTGLATACNDDIFIEGEDTPSEITAEMKGDEDEAVFTIQTKGLQRITVDYFSEVPTLWYYDKSGNEFSPHDSPVSKLAKISCRARLMAYDIEVSGNRLRAHTIENATGFEQIEYIRLEYDYTTKFIILNIAPGQPMKLAGIEYDNCFEVQDRYTVKRHTYNFTNDGPVDQHFEIKPFMGYSIECRVEPTENYASGEEIPMRLPFLAGGMWQYKPETPVKLSTTFYGKPDNWDVTEPVTVPANTKASVEVSVIMARCKAQGVMTFRLPVSGREYTTHFTTTVDQPVSYEIKR